MLKKLIVVLILTIFTVAVSALPAYAFSVKKTAASSSMSVPCPDMATMAKKSDTKINCCQDAFDCFQQCLSKVSFVQTAVLIADFTTKNHLSFKQNYFVFIPDLLLRPPKA